MSDRTWSSDAFAAKDTVEAGLRVSEAELVTMVGWSGPNFTDEAMSWTACVTLAGNHVAPEMRLRTSQFILDVLRVDQAPVWIRGLLVHSWVQTFADVYRALCKGVRALEV